MKTVTVNPETVETKWFIIDAKDAVLGRLASTAAGLLMGKNKRAWTPNQDLGDHVIIINAEKVAFTGNKRNEIKYFAHSTHPGGHRTLSVDQAMAIRPGYPVRHAIRGMLPHTVLGENMAKKLHIYDGEAHPHTAQKPQLLALK